MSKRCIVKNCNNHEDQGTFIGDICFPCYEFITEGKGIYSTVYKNAVQKYEEKKNV